MRLHRAACVEFEACVVEGRRPTVVARGEVDRATATAFAAALDRAISHGSYIEVDLREVTFVDSSGLRVLFDAYVRLGQLPEAMILRGPNPALRHVLTVAGIDHLFAHDDS
jgi:anti-sigma B factor antagonist